MNTVQYEVKDQVATITMARPEVKNAINEEMHKDLYDSFQEARRDSDVKVIVLTGTEGSFSSGADLKSIPIDQMDTFDHGEYLERTYNKLVTLLDDIEKPTVAYMNGTSVGAGLSLALACDFRFASPEAKIALSFLHIGLTPDAGASYFLPRLVGLGKALELGLGETISAEEALRIGLVTKLGDPDSFIHALKQAPSPAYGWMKKNMKTGLDDSLPEVLDAEVEGQRAAGKSDAHVKAVQFFLSRSKR
ncbi:enoyl-CoA hydratase [Salipaludibacillus keqinensis]|uniref:Enoyl-CoA hydratase n=1 Tax=Salipaludibacillus keqinensis TaxID=2045207 RepID=A0A323TAL6_9BACI|nr:enoyl-CoA hydratase/isomerase family protein [Salipaludibacillus keqinensis]PYZ91604.1 enoyl-CoA hydratase [Salipaludibacillus keqinensis]